VAVVLVADLPMEVLAVAVAVSVGKTILTSLQATVILSW
jgi:hypothetical protein